MFTITDKEVQARESTTWIQCSECGGFEFVHDQPDDERAIEEAGVYHVCPPRCVHCQEPMSLSLALSDEPNAIPVHRVCFEDDRQGVRESIMAYLSKQEAA